MKQNHVPLSRDGHPRISKAGQTLSDKFPCIEIDPLEKFMVWDAYVTDDDAPSSIE